MKLLHTADLHLGKTLHEQSLAEDQHQLLDTLVNLLAADDYTALLISGDVYDRSIPSAEAMQLLGTFLTTIKYRFPALTIIMCAGNHDSPERLGYGSPLFASLGIHIHCQVEQAWTPILLEKNGFRCAVFALPFLSPGCLKKTLPDGSEETIRSQKELAEEAARYLEEARQKASAAPAAQASILMAHVFAAGGLESESERVFLGTAERVDVNLFAGFSYVALGHLHQYQKVGKNAYYSGSPLAYSFDEADKQKYVVEVTLSAAAEPQVKPIPIVPKHRVSRLAGSCEAMMAATAHLDKVTDYLEITLTDDQLVQNPLALLRTRYPLVLSVRQDRALAGAQANREERISARRQGERLSALDEFSLFAADLYGQADEAETALFKTLMGELEHAAH